MKKRLLQFSLLFLAVNGNGNDTAVEISVGGLQVRNERNVIIKKELLSILTIKRSHEFPINDKCIRVEYDFENTSNQAVKTEVAFPLPPYSFSWAGNYYIGLDFNDFKIWVDNKKVVPKKLTHGFVAGRDITEYLQRAKISIDKFGFVDKTGEINQIEHCDSNTRDELVRIGALEECRSNKKLCPNTPLWEANVTYHWTQEFPPGVIIRIQHEYRPKISWREIQGENQLNVFWREHPDGCFDAKTRTRYLQILKLAEEKGVGPEAYWISYILSTANSWQTPIQDFQLVIEKNPNEVLSFCWDGKVVQLSPTRFYAKKMNFIPRQELRI